MSDRSEIEQDGAAALAPAEKLKLDRFVERAERIRSERARLDHQSMRLYCEVHMFFEKVRKRAEREYLDHVRDKAKAVAVRVEEMCRADGVDEETVAQLRDVILNIGKGKA